MLNSILGTKKHMSQTFIEGVRIPVTFVKAGPCVVTQIKEEGKDGYWGVQLGFGEKKIKNTTKPLQGHLKGAIKKKKLAPRYLQEIRLEDKPKFKVGDEIKVNDVLSPGDVISVTGVSKGKGFAGVVKRWGFAGGPRTHGQSDRLRAPGSIGQGTTPGRVHKGKKMPGRMGTQKTTIKNLKVVTVDLDNDEITLSGPVPGSVGTLLVIRKLASGKVEDLAKEGDKPVVQVEQVEEEEGEEKETSIPKQPEVTEKKDKGGEK